MKENFILRISYTVFLGLLFATFVGVGIAAFYKAPKMPESNVTPMRIPDSDSTKSAQFSNEEIKMQQDWEDYNDKQKIYDRNVSAGALGFSVAYIVLGLLFFKQIFIISDGLVLGGVFTLLYSIARGFNSQDELFRFFVVTVGLIIALFLGYTKFVKQNLQK